MNKFDSKAAPPWESPEWQAALSQTPALKPFFDNLESYVELPEGVKRLREMILDFAVRGILSEQCEDDQPAAELLEEVAEERKRLEKAKEIRKQKYPPPPSGEEIPHSLPAGWAWTRLSIIGEIGPRNDVADGLEVSFLPMKTIADGFTSSIEPESRPWSEIKKGFTHLGDGDIALAKITPCFQNRKSAVMRDLLNGVGAGTTELHVVRPIPNSVIPEYALLHLKCLTFLNVGVSKMTGSAGQKRVPKDYFANTPFPFPPLAEQRRIVSKVEGLMSLCDTLEDARRARISVRERASRSVLASLTSAPRVGVQPLGAGEHESAKGSAKAGTPAPLKLKRETLKSAWHRLSDHFEVLLDQPSGVDSLRQSILQLAVQGKLVPQDPSDECVDTEIAASREAADMKKVEIESVEGEFDIPDNWRWVTVHDVAEHRLGKMLDKAKNSGNPQPYLRNTNVHWFRFELSSLKDMLFEDDELDEFEVRRGDLLICEGGHGIARTAVWECELDRVMFQKALHRVRPLQCLNSYFLAFCLRVYESTGILQRYYTGAGIPHFTGRALAKVEFPLPPLAEQKRIVSKVSVLLSQCDELSARLRSRQSTTDALLTALIHQILRPAEGSAK